MITFVQPPLECDYHHMKLWDEFLTLILDADSRELINRVGIERVVEQLRKGPEGRYKATQCGLFIQN